MAHASDGEEQSLLNSDPESLMSYGNSLLAQNDYKGAINAYTKALAELDPDNDQRQQDKDKKQVDEKQQQQQQEPSLRSVLYSNRSHANLSLGSAAKALDDAEK